MPASLALFFMAMIRPMIAKIMVSLGLAVITYTGTSLALSTLRTLITSTLGGMSSDVANMMGLIGLGDAAGILLGAWSFRLAMNVTKRIGMAS